MKLCKFVLFGISAALLITGCSFHHKPDITQQEPQIRLDDTALKIGSLDAAKTTKITSLTDSYLGKKDGRDCSGFVSLINKKNDDIYFKESNLSKFYSKYGLKSEAIFNLYKNKNLISHDDPKVGDLIFFNNTTKKTRNFKKTQVITHIGIINKIHDDGTVQFAHNIKGRNINGFMNLDKKTKHKIGKKELNSYIVSCKKGQVSCLTSSRFAGFGKVQF